MRSGLLSDVQLYEDYPATYDADVARRHRWIRGDWQIARSILPHVPGQGNALKNPLSLLSRWKIIDNLRRSLVPVVVVLLLLLTWMRLSPIWAWTLTVIGAILAPVVLGAFFDLLRKPDDMTLAQHLSEVAGAFGRHFAQGLFTLVCLPYALAPVPRGQSSVIVRSYMSHHQEISLVALSSVLLDRPMQRRFEAIPMFQATTLLLQEKVPRASSYYSPPVEIPEARRVADELETPMRVFRSPNTAAPEVQLLSNGRYHVMVSNSGGGYSRWKDIAVTRWREDSHLRQLGHVLLYPRCGHGSFWSTALSAHTRNRGRELRSDFLAGEEPISVVGTTTLKPVYGDRGFPRG